MCSRRTVQIAMYSAVLIKADMYVCADLAVVGGVWPTLSLFNLHKYAKWELRTTVYLSNTYKEHAYGT